LSTHLHLGLPSGRFPSGFPTNKKEVYLDILLIIIITLSHYSLWCTYLFF
jgi:hypothetical protein